MRKIIALIVFTAVTTLVFPQTKCTQPLTFQQFQQRYKQIDNRTTDAAKIQLANQLVKSYCFSSEQIKEIALLFDDDNYRLQFAQSAYNNTTDKDNFYEVYDAFIYYSNVFRLHDFINGKTTETSFAGNSLNEIDNTKFPDYHYPDFVNYTGQKKCTQYISQRQFNSIVNQIKSSIEESAKLTKAKTLIQNNCIPTEYLMKMGSLFSSENNRLDFAKAGLSSVYDIDHYLEMKQIFSTPKSRSIFTSFLAQEQSSTSISGTVSAEKCLVSQNEFNAIINSLKNENFNSTKLKSAKNIIETKTCLSPTQIKKIINVFDYENSRLEIAKLGFDFTKNKNDYYSIVSGALGFESSKKKLLDYINSKR
ncbi:MAG: DUF4476 domain-containing protein [Bacteroidota bacterium]|nr:DUF4476 domain-containing protein [Bacteroidota bacterium]